MSVRTNIGVQIAYDAYDTSINELSTQNEKSKDFDVYYFSFCEMIGVVCSGALDVPYPNFFCAGPDIKRTKIKIIWEMKSAEFFLSNK